VPPILNAHYMNLNPDQSTTTLKALGLLATGQ
jgi:hypothetical protein